MIRHPGRAGGPWHIVVDEPRRHEEEPDDNPLTWLGDPRALPYLDVQGSLVLPMNAPTRYRWWQGGQSMAQTMTDLGGVP